MLSKIVILLIALDKSTLNSMTLYPALYKGTSVKFNDFTIPYNHKHVGGNKNVMQTFTI